MKALLPKIAFALALAGGSVAANGSDAADAIVFGDLPLELALTQVRGNGKRWFATFEDPNCPYCKRMANEIAQLNDVTMHTFIYPVLGPDSVSKAKAIWCAKDRAAAWNSWMRKGTVPPAARCDARAVDALLALGRKLEIRATPTLFLADGTRLTGALSKMELETAISSPRVMSFQAGMDQKKKSSPR